LRVSLFEKSTKTLYTRGHNIEHLDFYVLQGEIH
jgi:hypothetical protein